MSDGEEQSMQNSIWRRAIWTEEEGNGTGMHKENEEEAKAQTERGISKKQRQGKREGEKVGMDDAESQKASQSANI